MNEPITNRDKVLLFVYAMSGELKDDEQLRAFQHLTGLSHSDAAAAFEEARRDGLIEGGPTELGFPL